MPKDGDVTHGPAGAPHLLLNAPISPDTIQGCPDLLTISCFADKLVAPAPGAESRFDHGQKATETTTAAGNATMKISEFRVKPHILEGIKSSAVEGASLAGVKAADSPLKVVKAINTFVSKPPRKKAEQADAWTDLAIPLGSLWGQQLARQFDWEWSGVVFHDLNDTKAIGVFTKDRSLAVYPWHFVFGCLENQATVTILLAFNMLLAEAIPAQPNRGYLNIMDHVHHIVPPA